MNILDMILSLLRRLFGGDSAAADPPPASPAASPPVAVLPVAGQPGAQRRINAAGINLTKRSETCRLVAFQDGGGTWTLGWGRTAGITEGMTCTQAQADAWLLEDMAEAERACDRALPFSCSSNQFSALCDFTYVEGSGGLTELLAHGIDQVPAQLPRWIYVKGQVEGGLVTRRAAEVTLWETP